LRQLEFLPTGIEYVVFNHPQSPTEFFIARKLNKLGATHVFSPMQLMGSVGRKYKLVLTLHDLIYYRHRKPPQDLNLLVRIIWRLYHLSYQPQRWLLNRADAVATVSNTTKKLIQKHHLTRRPVVVVYNAPEKQATSKVPVSSSSKNLVYIGSFMQYKNVETLVEAAGLLSGYNLHLLSKISSGRKQELQELANKVGATVTFHNGVSDQQYRDLLSQAFALVSASKDEGFGIPLVEAMQQGVPVVVTDLDIFKEVAGPAGTYFDANSPQDLAKAVLSLEDQPEWTRKSKLALSQAQVFDWDKSAEALISQFEELDS
jgi:glycosyltransferase involved in cell wall biosynthesis